MKPKRRIFLLDDDALIVDMLGRALREEGYDVRTEQNPGGVAEKITAFAPDVVMLDINLPGANGVEILERLKNAGLPAAVVMLTADDTAETAVKAMKLGASDYLVKPFNLEEVKIVVRRTIEEKSLRQEVDCLRRISAEGAGQEIVGDSPSMRAVKDRVAKLAQARVATVLITGESGTGKELVARNLHRLMGEGGPEYAPFVPVNCTALPEQLLESELFGHERGSFTDARAERKGLFELAEGGTLLLDEIGDMKADLQGKLLRAIEERRIRRVGAREEIPVALTVIATTNRDLARAVEAGSFRSDLYYRLAAFSVEVPPLRQRREDIPALAAHFLSLFSEKYNRRTFLGVSADAQKLLAAHDWPGNVRELRNSIERVVVLENGNEVLPGHISWALPGAAPAAGGAEPFRLPAAGISLDDLEKDLIVQALERSGSNKTLAAKLLNISYDSLRYQIKKFGLE
ncbi:MAG: sigma-54-dependent Fis family transcriptional regulator [Deltaproteobacteria bacterium]|nr:sigma-54-dependent Fis family transcriptional regulator [Deltaproteobacteria bacterium]